jgi:hypothetical protein
MKKSIYTLLFDIEKSSTTIKNKEYLVEQLNTKIQKATLDKEKASATLPINIKERDLYLQSLRDLYNEQTVTKHLDDVLDLDSKKPEGIYKDYYMKLHNRIRAVLKLEPLTIPETTENPN